MRTKSITLSTVKREKKFKLKKCHFGCTREFLQNKKTSVSEYKSFNYHFRNTTSMGFVHKSCGYLFSSGAQTALVLVSSHVCMCIFIEKICKFYMLKGRCYCLVLTLFLTETILQPMN